MDFPEASQKKLIDAYTPSSSPPNQTDINTDPADTTAKIWIHLVILEKFATQLTREFTRKVNRLLKYPCKFLINWTITESNHFVSCKDRTPTEYQSSVVYKFACPGCRDSYIGKTERCLINRINEHATNSNSEIYKHIKSREDFEYLKTLMELSPEMNTKIECNSTQLILNNCKIINKAEFWSLLLFKEALAIHRQNPSPNHGTKALKDLVIFY